MSPDADTRSRYDDAIVELARCAQIEPEAVRETAERLAAGHLDRDARLADVGAYYIAEGRPELEAALRCRVSMRTRIRRAVLARIRTFYVAGVLVVWSALVALAISWLRTTSLGIGAGVLVTITIGLFAFEIARKLIDIALVVPLTPKAAGLPKYDFSTGIPADYQTLVVQPVIVPNEHEVDELLRMLETNYLGNADPRLTFWLVTDLSDADREELPTDHAIIERIATGITTLNRRHGGEGYVPFHHLHRKRRYNAVARRWMGWERKRGKLVELNRMILGIEDAFEPAFGDRSVARSAKYVITLDADTLLIPGSAARMVGALAHPLVRPRFDGASRRVAAGHAILQPRVVCPPWGNSRLSKMSALTEQNPLTPRPVRQAHQLVLGEGVFWGKGIYDVAALERVLADRFPEGRVLSHDKLEGALAHVAFLPEVVLVESWPNHVSSMLARGHRWTRGDIQASPWCLPLVPSATGWTRSPLPMLNRLNVAGDFVAAVRPPLHLGLWIMLWFGYLPGPAAFWIVLPFLLAILTATYFALLFHVVRAIFRGMTIRAGMEIALLLPTAVISLDAVARASYRMTPFGRRRALEWTTAAAAERRGLTSAAAYWRAYILMPVTSVALAVAIAVVNPFALWFAAPVLATWFVAPSIFHRLSLPIEQEVATLPLPDLLVHYCAERGRPLERATNG